MRKQCARKKAGPGGVRGPHVIPTGEGAQGLLEAAVISALAESIVPAGKSGMGHFHRFSHFGAPKRGAIPHANSVKLRGPRWRRRLLNSIPVW